MTKEMKLFVAQQPINTITPSTEFYCIVPVEAGGRYKIPFDKYTEYYIIFTKSVKCLFFNAFYFGGIVIKNSLTENGTWEEEHWKFFVRAAIQDDFVVLIHDCPYDRVLFTIDEDRHDIIWEEEFNYKSQLRSHLERKYSEYLTTMPAEWDEYFARLWVDKNLDFTYDDNHIDFKQP